MTHCSEEIPHLKETLMPDIRLITAVRPAIVPMFSKQFILRFAISVLLTGVDADVALAFARPVFTAIFNVPILRAAFAILIPGLIASLAHMWFLTFRGRP
jgi:hypothetical protein